MTEISTAPVPSDDSAEAAAFRAMRTDAVLTGRAMSSGQFLAGLLANAELETVGSPDKLPTDLFPGDPALVQAVWDRALAVGFNAGRKYWASRTDPREWEETRAALEAAGYNAMAGVVGRSRRLVERARVAHQVDREIAREH